MPISVKLKQLKLVSGAKTLSIFDNLYSDILTIPYSSESDLMNELWSRKPPLSKSLNGNVFEGILATILYRSNILPIYTQAKIAYVPNVNFDFVVFSREFGPINLSAKTSLRERYKQADLEGMLLRQVHRKSKSFLITIDSKEAKILNKKIEGGSVYGLDQAIVAVDKEFDKLITHLKTLNYYKPEKVDVLTSSKVIT
tara:strand:- start:137 stop:730 length:594 start_codon:yes stop_codon:yes gene_type:complete